MALLFIYLIFSFIFCCHNYNTFNKKEKKFKREWEKWLIDGIEVNFRKNSWTGPSSFWVKNALCWAFILCNILPAAYFFLNISYWIRFKEIFFFNI